MPLSYPLAPALLLIPQPKQVLLSGVNLRLTPGTRLVVAPGAAPLDRLAAQSVQEEMRRLGLRDTRHRSGGMDIAFARRYGMMVTPLVNSAGHMPWLFRQAAF